MSSIERMLRRGAVGTAPLLMALLAGCAAVPDAQPTATAPAAAQLTERPTSITREMLVGRWGVASFREERDRARMEAQARVHCRLPYTIALGGRTGVMMHVADDANLYELRLKGGSDGKTYLGFEAPPGHRQDREILSVTQDQIVMRFVDPDVHLRYGTTIYRRCP